MVHPERALRQETSDVLSQNASYSLNLLLGTYNILIFDIEADGSVDLMQHVYNEMITVNPTIVSPSPTASLLVPGLSV